MSGSWTSRLPHRLLAATARGLERAERLVTELAVALQDPAGERAETDAFHNGFPKYASPEHVGRGLYPFEARALERFFPAAPARLLVPGAGAGREAIALCDRGYQVDAFDPAERLVDIAREKLATRGAGVWQASVQDWAARPAGAYDGVFSGWSMWSYVLRQSERLAVLRAFRAVCPRGPVLLSFFRTEKLFDEREGRPVSEPLHPSPQPGLQRTLRSGLRRRLLRRDPVERGTGWWQGVYFHRASEAELREECALTGWTVAHYERDGSRNPNAVLLPAPPAIA